MVKMMAIWPHKLPIYQQIAISQELIDTVQGRSKPAHPPPGARVVRLIEEMRQRKKRGDQIASPFQGSPDITLIRALYGEGELDRFEHSRQHFEAEVKKFPDLLEPYLILLGQTKSQDEQQLIMWRALRETFRRRYPPAVPPPQAQAPRWEPPADWEHDWP
jgi:hypothetical protein